MRKGVARKESEVRFRLMFSVAVALSTMVLEAASASNGYIDVYTSCIDVLVIKGIDNDFHLLVTNKNASARVSVIAHNPPYRLVKPGSGDGVVSIGHPMRYEVAKAQNGNAEKDGEPSTGGWIIMFCPDFTVVSDAPSNLATKEANALTDNFTATVNVVPNGIPTLAGHSPNMIVEAEERQPKINHDYNFNIGVAVDECSNVWPTSKTLWYGVNDGHGGCCNSNRFRYEFKLIVDGFVCKQLYYSVGWPNLNPEFKRPKPTNRGIICSGYMVEHCPGNANGDYRAELLLADYPKGTGYFVDLPDVSQYAAETQKEELFHQKQWLGLVGLDKGGAQDLFTAKGARHFLSTNPFVCSDGYVYGNTEQDVETRAVAALQHAEDMEFLVSDFIMTSSLRRNFMEYHAKAFAGYNAAWRYHCTYGQGSESEPNNKFHPAFIRR